MKWPFFFLFEVANIKGCNLKTETRSLWSVVKTHSLVSPARNLQFPTGMLPAAVHDDDF